MYPMIRDDFGSKDTPGAVEERVRQEPVGIGEALASQAGQTTGDLMRFAKHKMEPEPFFHEGGISSPEELNKQYNLKGENQFKTYMPNDTAAEMVKAMERRKKADETYARFSEQHGYLTRMATGFIGSLLDPVEDAAMFVPGIGEERIAYKLATMGYGRQAAAFMSKVGAGATAGMAGAAALEPLKAVMSHDELRDWEVRDALTDVFSAAPAGALMHAGLVPAARAAASFIPGVKPAPYVHDYSFWDKETVTPDEMARRMQLGIKGGVQKAFGEEIDKQPPSPGHISELERMDAIQRHVFTSSTFAQLMSGRKPDAGEWLFPDHTEQARRLAPEAHAEWDKLQEELSSIHAGHVWGEPPTPEQLNDPAWKLEQELREHVKGILPVSWDLRVATTLDHEAPKAVEEQPLSELDALKKERADVESWHQSNLEREVQGAAKTSDWRREHYAKRAHELDQRIKELETPTHVNEPSKPASLEEAPSEQTPAFSITDNEGGKHNVNVIKSPDEEGHKVVNFSVGDGVAKVKMKQRDDGRWEVSWMEVKKDMRHRGIMGNVYDAIEREYGNQMIPSGLLKEKGYNFWKERNPEAVKYHRQVEDYGSDYLSPRFIKEQISEFESELQKAVKTDDKEAAKEYRQELRVWKGAWNSIPEAGKTPEAIEAMYSFGGVSAANRPKGLKVAQAMEKRGHRKEDIWQDTGWHRGPTGGWRFEIDDSKASIITGNLNTNKSNGRITGSVPLGSLLVHPDLYKHYPDLQDLNVKISINKNSIRNESGLHYQYPNKNGISIHVDAHSIESAKSILLHEIQHAIQNRELEESPTYNSPETANLHPKYKEIVKEVRAATKGDKSKDWNMWIRYSIYQHMQKEIESRLVQNRLDLSKGERKTLPPLAGLSEFYEDIPKVVMDIVTKHLGTEIFNAKAYADYLRSPEYSARQDAINSRKERIRSALEDLKANAEPAREKARIAAEQEKARIEKAKADEEAAKQRAADARRRAEAIKAADIEVVRTEAQARKAQADLDKLTKEIQKAAEAEEKARQAAVSAEANLHKANERLAEAEANYKAAEQEHAKLQKEMVELDTELEDARLFLEAEERERMDIARKREGETIVAQGMSDPNTRTAWISAMAVDPKLVAREESGHAIRMSGLLKGEEWGILRDAAINRGWIDDIPKNIRAKYEEVYASRGADGVRDAMVEEAIMHRFADGPGAWGPQGGPVARLMHRIKELLERIGNWMTSRGFQSASDVLHAMDSGKVSSRETMAPHPARRMKEIEARMEELKPQLLEAYETARNNSPYDIPSLATIQKNRANYGEAPAIPQGELTKVLEQLYGPKEERKFTAAKFGEIPPELQLDEQRFQSMMEEGYKPDPDEVSNHLETQRALQEALSMEQGYQQAAECLITAGFR
jgi:hypothetical protein